jgi:simple sugar transport system ATP-binding protein
MIGIVKRFPGVLANDHVNFDVKAGEIHALLGENGAGKSTLMRQLYGLYRPDEGEIRINGQPRRFSSPAAAIQAGIGMIHQHFMLVPTLTVAENVALGLKSSREPQLDLDKVTARIKELAARYGLKVDPNAYVWQLAVGEQQRVEIVKALYRGAALLVLDEPTAVLTPQEADDLFVTLRQMAKDGHALIFISHKLHEVIAISKRVTVLRDGRTVGTNETAKMTKSELAQLMVGREVILQYDRPPAQPGEARLQIQAVWAKGDRGADALRGVSLDIHVGDPAGAGAVEWARRYPQITRRPDCRRTGQHPGRTNAGRRHQGFLGDRKLDPTRSRPHPLFARNLSEFQSDCRKIGAVGGRVSSEDPDAGDSSQESLRRQYPKVDPGAGTIAQTRRPRRRPAHARRGHRRQ